MDKRLGSSDRNDDCVKYVEKLSRGRGIAIDFPRAFHHTASVGVESRAFGLWR
ncbi:hypothetical protein PVL29_013361 [Vitis rotundifolia]|uniref:Uncharacterized protein n=1 Tax=Vitis rotundifolia TaxID=103349 RepID=A0AA38ZM61_VITRO|nr:hypothetical protein PVL29_013361 [Vitis rotundifolia]